jgi:hypothetical protein
LASQWEFRKDDAEGGGNDPFVHAPRGQYWGGRPPGCPHAEAFRVYEVQDRTMRGVVWMDANDAIFAEIACDKDGFTLVKTFAKWEDVAKHMRNGTLARELKGCDLLVLGSWIFDVLDECDSNVLQTAAEWLEKFQQFELESGCRIFPPLSYTWYFSRKELYYHHLSRVVEPPARTIPCVFVLPSDNGERWKEEVKWERVVLKRSLSEYKQHHIVLNKKQVPRFRLKTEGAAWLMQPFLKEFSKYREVRLYIVDGVFLFGVETCFDEETGDSLQFPLGKCVDAVVVAQKVVNTVSEHCHQDAKHFLRVDMVQCDSGGWYLNELECFGTASIRLEEAHDALPKMVHCIKTWMQNV